MLICFFVLCLLFVYCAQTYSMILYILALCIFAADDTLQMHVEGCFFVQNLEAVHLVENVNGTGVFVFLFISGGY